MVLYLESGLCTKQGADETIGAKGLFKIFCQKERAEVTEDQQCDEEQFRHNVSTMYYYLQDETEDYTDETAGLDLDDSGVLGPGRYRVDPVNDYQAVCREFFQTPAHIARKFHRVGLDDGIQAKRSKYPQKNFVDGSESEG